MAPAFLICLLPHRPSMLQVRSRVHHPFGLLIVRSWLSPGKNVTKSYCEYLDVKHPVGTKWTVPYPNCYDCQCAEYGLDCCV